jgi:hypothetical protein
VAVVLDGAFATLQLVTMVTGPAWQGNVYPGSVAALVLTVLVTLTAMMGFFSEWRRILATGRLFNLAVACLVLPALLVVMAFVPV